jgi:hypothetical protein
MKLQQNWEDRVELSSSVVGNLHRNAELGRIKMFSYTEEGATAVEPNSI